MLESLTYRALWCSLGVLASFAFFIFRSHFSIRANPAKIPLQRYAPRGAMRSVRFLGISVGVCFAACSWVIRTFSRPSPPEMGTLASLARVVPEPLLCLAVGLLPVSLIWLIKTSTITTGLPAKIRLPLVWIVRNTIDRWLETIAEEEREHSKPYLVNNRYDLAIGKLFEFHCVYVAAYFTHWYGNPDRALTILQETNPGVKFGHLRQFFGYTRVDNEMKQVHDWPKELFPTWKHQRLRVRRVREQEPIQERRLDTTERRRRRIDMLYVKPFVDRGLKRINFG